MGNTPSSSPYGLYSATPVENYKIERMNRQEWKLVKPLFKPSYWEWVGTGPKEKCGSCINYGMCLNFGYHGCEEYKITKKIFEGPPCPGQDTTCPLLQKGGGRKKRKPSKKTRKASRR